MAIPVIYANVATNDKLAAQRPSSAAAYSLRGAEAVSSRLQRFVRQAPASSLGPPVSQERAQQRLHGHLTAPLDSPLRKPLLPITAASKRRSRTPSSAYYSSRRSGRSAVASLPPLFFPC